MSQLIWTKVPCLVLCVTIPRVTVPNSWTAPMVFSSTMLICRATPHFACDTCRMKKVGRHCLNASSLGRVLTTIPSIAQMQWPKNRLRSLQSHVKLLRVQPHRRRHPRETTETWRRPTERQEPALGFALTIKLGRPSQKILVTAQGAASRPTRKFPK